MRRGMKRKAAVLAVCLALAWGNIQPDGRWGGKGGETVWAQDEAAKGEQGEVYLGIDSSHAYETMNKPFSQGYLPAVEGDIVRLAVPFTSSGPLEGDRITVRLVLEEDGPFDYANYEKTVEKQQYTFGEEQMETYLYLCDVGLDRERINGKYPVTVQAEGVDTGGRRVQLECRLYVTVTDGQDPGQSQDSQQNKEEEQNGQEEAGQDHPGDPLKEGADGTDQGNFAGPEEEEPGSLEEPDAGVEGMTVFDGTDSPGGDMAAAAEDGEVIHQPKMILEPGNLAGCTLEAGGETSLAPVFRNRSRDQKICNLEVTAAPVSEMVMLKNTSFYFETVAPQETIELSLEAVVSPQAEQGSTAVDLTFEYENEEETAYTGTERLWLNVRQPVQVSLEGVQLPETVYSTETASLPVQIRNLGRAPVYNVQAKLEGRGLFPTETVFAGNMEAGTASEGIMEIYVGNRCMEEIGQETEGSDEEKYGSTTAVLTLTYEDAFGQEYSQTQELSTVIQKPEVTQLKVEKSRAKTNQWWAAILLVLALATVGTTAGMGLKLRKGKRQMAALLREREERRRG